MKCTQFVVYQGRLDGISKVEGHLVRAQGVIIVA